MGWGDIWGEVEGAMSSGVDDVEKFFGVGDTPQQAQQVAGQAAAAAPAAQTKSSWWEKAIKQSMPTIMGAAMKPQGVEPRAPVAPGGHGVQASGGTAMQPFQEVTKLADDNPLANIHQWSNLF